MVKWINNILRRITGVSTPIGGLSWSPSKTEDGQIPTFREPIYITYPDNQEVLSFLRANNNKIIFLDTHIDASIAIKEQFDLVEKENIDMDLITSCNFSGVSLPLPNKDDELITITFYFRDDHVLKYSAGGTGVVTVGINGFFEVSQTFHGGPSIAYHLKEVAASLEAKVKILNT